MIRFNAQTSKNTPSAVWYMGNLGAARQQGELFPWFRQPSTGLQVTHALLNKKPTRAQERGVTVQKNTDTQWVCDLS